MRSTADEARARVLAAARSEFAEHGFAGARVDRISSDASTSKERLYAYFGSKQGLWDALVTQEVAELDAIGSVRSLDGGGIVGRLFDRFVGDPIQLKLFFWLIVEGVNAPGLSGRSAELQANKVELVTQAQQDGTVDDALPPDVIVRLLITVAANCADQYLAGAQDAARRDQIRAATCEVGRRILSPARSAPD
jgi:AcrR family transcriptional regulator